MTTYNGEKYLHEQIDSILAQTIQNFELIICDDCSKDSTWDILSDYSQIDNRIQIFRNEENIGFKKNFEKALSLCQGDYIALSDQDDIWMPNHLEVLKSIIGNKMMSCGNCEMINEKGHSLNISFKDLESLDYVPNKWKERIMSIIFLGILILEHQCYYAKNS